MNLIFKAAVGIYIVSVLVFSSFSKADTDFVFGTNLYDLATTPVPVSSIINNERVLTETAIIVSGLPGKLTENDGVIYFVSSEEDQSFFKVSPAVIEQFGINELPVSVTVSGFYQPSRQVSSFQKLNTLNIGDIQIN